VLYTGARVAFADRQGEWSFPACADGGCHMVRQDCPEVCAHFGRALAQGGQHVLRRGLPVGRAHARPPLASLLEALNAIGTIASGRLGGSAPASDRSTLTMGGG
jgi:hypothetical protein